MSGAWAPENDNTTTTTKTTVMDVWKQDSEGKKSFLLYYIGIEAVWHVALFTACYRYRPFVRLSKTASGHKLLTSLRRRISGSNITQKSSSLLSSSPPWKKHRWASWMPPRRTVVAASEWFFFNKVIGIPLWPTKILLAGWIHNKLSLRLSLETKAAAEGPIQIHTEENEGSFV
mmetsp:Transcript_16107/g.23703  ORF Transcript_16107/g.23703 Transcript_16107/m.23703 type:complete len:174 (-) Transcript_16107:211-732(-)|eukprot:CAMPEP_0194220396 /NCGR_PEP_ID=MMETSP0156-20130528/28261_1 /TAXON_ID=33649 /ORGANISM="Thalassionema nitzschioides, Strain L26-B" /LENGTH=173 /DNA_ID=CAMNT_0038950413 /DNA_START=60 /DNA_END=581 /DNA_ORIENTATION=-